MEIIAAVFAIVLSLAFFAGFVYVGWVLPITLGIKCARRKGVSTQWMWFGIHPLGGWIAFIVLNALTPRVQCLNCGGMVGANFWQCPFCHSPMPHAQGFQPGMQAGGSPSAQTPGWTPPSSPPQAQQPPQGLR